MHTQTGYIKIDAHACMLYVLKAKLHMPLLHTDAFFMQSEENKFNCSGFQLFKDVNRICVVAVLRKS